MTFNDFMSKVRYWDNRMAKWMVRHFYILFFEIFLVFIFIGLFIVTLKAIDLSHIALGGTTIEQLLFLQMGGMLLIALLILLNSFWMLYVFNGILRMNSNLKEINFNLTKHRNS
ncbi:MAG: hypothetical protein WC676_04840 [Candidatus Omnitrophota bacterium]